MKSLSYLSYSSYLNGREIFSLNCQRDDNALFNYYLHSLPLLYYTPQTSGNSSDRADRENESIKNFQFQAAGRTTFERREPPTPTWILFREPIYRHILIIYSQQWVTQRMKK